MDGRLSGVFEKMMDWIVDWKCWYEECEWVIVFVYLMLDVEVRV